MRGRAKPRRPSTSPNRGPVSARPHWGPLLAAGRERLRGQARRKPRLRPRSCRRCVGVCRRDRGGEASRERQGEGGGPLPILGRSRRRRRPAVGESKVVAGRHFGIFPQPAGHCGGHGESGPMARGEARRDRDTEGSKGRERPCEKPPSPGRGRGRAASPSRLALSHLLARPGGGRRLLPGASPNPRASPLPKVGKGAGQGPQWGTLYSP